MILDNEEQRAMLLQIINAIPLQGNYEALQKTMNDITVLQFAILSAEIVSKVG